MDVEVHNAPDRHRYEAYVGNQIAGIAAYHRDDGRLVFTHTEVAGKFEGRGVGGRLIRGALDDARLHRFGVRPLCPFVAGWIARHPEYADLVGPGDAALLENADGGGQDSASR